MENTITAIELGTKKLKLVVGYELDGKVYSVYTMTKSFGDLQRSNGFLDFQKLVETVSSIKEINDENARFSTKVNEAVVALPADGLEIYQTIQRTTVVSELGKIAPIDIKNLYMLIKNSCVKSSNMLVDIVPEKFTLDDGKTLNVNPIGEISGGLTIHAKIHLSPEHIYKNYYGVFENAGIGVKRVVCAPLGAVEYLSTVEGLPNYYWLVDIGSDFCSVSLVGRDALFGAKYFNWGGDFLTKAISEKFNISLEDAEKYKKIYGIDTREMNFRAPICTDEGGSVNKHFYKEDLNEILYKGLDDFIELLKPSIEAITLKQRADIHNELRKLPIVLIGGGSQLKGIADYLSGKVDNTDVRVVTPTVIGARDATYTNCLGMILAAKKYMSMNDDPRFRAGSITRD